MKPDEQVYMGTAEVAEYLGKSKQTICNWVKRGHSGFPAPVIALRCGPIWLTADIVAYKKRKAPGDYTRLALGTGWGSI